MSKSKKTTLNTYPAPSRKGYRKTMKRFPVQAAKQVEPKVSTSRYAGQKTASGYVFE